jgi:serine phosphatase RsbU (regulator of sigma subunit)
MFEHAWPVMQFQNARFLPGGPSGERHMLDPIAAVSTQEPSLTRFNGLEISSRIIPAAGAPRGGDWCDAFAVDDDVLAISIGDVCGHGVEKFDAMVAMRQAIRDAALRNLDPAQTLAHVNRFLYEHDPGEIVTAIVGFMDTRRRSLIYANAGHPPPIVAGPHGASFLEWADADVPLGIEPHLMPAIREAGLPASTLVVFYTDGVSESRRDLVQGANQLCAAAKFARDFPELPSAGTIEAMTLSARNFDDAAILTVRTPLFPIIRSRRAKRYAAGAAY